MDRPTCEGVTKAGGRCRSFALPGSSSCFMHGDPAAAAAARSRGATTAGKLRALRGKRRRLDSHAGLAAFLTGIIYDVAEGRLDPDVARVIIYGCSVMRQLAEHALEHRLAEVERLLAQRRLG